MWATLKVSQYDGTGEGLRKDSTLTVLKKKLEVQCSNLKQ